MIMKSPYMKFFKNTMEMGMHKIIEQMGKTDFKNHAKS
jgi:hypothetical protein